MISITQSDLKRVGRGNGIYANSTSLSRRNPINKKKILPFSCKICIEKQVSTTGRTKHFRTVNQIHGHCSFDHKMEDYKPYLIQLVENIFSGRLK